MSGFAPPFSLTACRAAPALLLAAASAQALGQAPLVGFADQSRAFTPAERISANLLAGGMSRLAAISDQQRGSMAASWMPQASMTEAIVNDRRIANFRLPGWQLQGVQLSLPQPLLYYRQPDLMPSFMRDFAPAPAPQANAPAPQTSAFLMPVRPVPTLSSRPAPRDGQPDIFGSVAMPVSRTLLDGKWTAVSGTLTGKGLWSGIVQAARGSAARQQAEMINGWVNHRLRFVDDRQGGDAWASAARTLQSGAGDCEDYAIAKMKLLEAAGFDPRALFLVIARDLVRQADHAVLAVRIGGELMILDNMTDRVLPSSEVSDYRPILTFNAFGRWTHGYRVVPSRPVLFAGR